MTPGMPYTRTTRTTQQQKHTVGLRVEAKTREELFDMIFRSRSAKMCDTVDDINPALP